MSRIWLPKKKAPKVRKGIHELDRDLYFRSLREKDHEPLVTFLVQASAYLEAAGLPMAMLAVGSSTFPPRYWTHMTPPHVTGYNDIDLRLIPRDANIPIEVTQDLVQGALDQLCIPHHPLNPTPMGTDYDKQFLGNLLPFEHRSYDLHSIRTQLRSGTQLDLILGKKDFRPSAAEHIREERKNKGYFSVLRE